MKIKSLLVKQYTNKGLMLNESVSKNGKYILEGPFGVVSDSPNNNGRIYTKEEYLPHIKELRDEIKNGTPILGEIDHPEDRFEVKLKEASHRVIDLWFDNTKNMVMGKIELLNTPNGKILQSLVEQQIPIFISSRAAGTVGPDNKVNIKRIFTWDAVYKPGFKECKLELVNESYREPVSKFLNKTFKTKKNIANEFNILNENIEIYEMKKMPNLKFKKELTKSDIESLTKPITESDKNDKFKNEDDSALTPAGNDLPQVSNEDLAAKLGLPSETHDANERIEKDKTKDSLFLDIEGEYSKDNNKDTNNDDTKDGDDVKDNKDIDNTKDGDDNKDDDDDKDFILDIEAEGVTNNDEDDDDEENDDEENDENNNTKKSTKKSKIKGEDDLDLEEDTGKKVKKKPKALNSDININKYKQIINKYKTNEAIELEFNKKYPKFANLNEINRGLFMNTLSESERSAFHEAAVVNNVNESEDFINKYYNIGYSKYMAEKTQVNESIWLRHAPKKYKKIYEQLNTLGKKKINDLAECFIYNSQDDVNSFWESTGLLHRVVNKDDNKTNIAYDHTNENEHSIYEDEPMYNLDVIKTFENKMQELNNGEYDLV